MRLFLYILNDFYFTFFYIFIIYIFPFKYIAKRYHRQINEGALSEIITLHIKLSQFFILHFMVFSQMRPVFCLIIFRLVKGSACLVIRV